MEFDIEKKKEVDTVDVLVRPQRHLQLEAEPVQLAVAVVVILGTLRKKNIHQWSLLNFLFLVSNLYERNPRVVTQELVVVFERAPADGALRLVRLHEHEELVLEVNLWLLAVVVHLLPESF